MGFAETKKLKRVHYQTRPTRRGPRCHARAGRTWAELRCKEPTPNMGGRSMRDSVRAQWLSGRMGVSGRASGSESEGGLPRADSGAARSRVWGVAAAPTDCGAVVDAKLSYPNRGRQLLPKRRFVLRKFHFLNLGWPIRAPHHSAPLRAKHGPFWIYNQKNNTQLSRHFIFHISYLHFSHEAFLNAHTSIAHAARCAVRRMPRAGASV